MLEQLTARRSRARARRRAARGAARQGRGRGGAARFRAGDALARAQARRCRPISTPSTSSARAVIFPAASIISTGTALLAAACGLPVVKHGNRSVTSQQRQRRRLEQLGLALPLDEQRPAQCLASTGFTFLFAPYYHPAMKALAPVRAALGVRTVFNLLGPLTNPAAPPLPLIGAYDEVARRLIADALGRYADRAGLVVHGANGWDEPTPVGPFTAFDVTPGARVAPDPGPGRVRLAALRVRGSQGRRRAANCAGAARRARRARIADRTATALLLQCGACAAISPAAAPRWPPASAPPRRRIDSGRARAWLGRLEQFAAQGGAVAPAAAVRRRPVRDERLPRRHGALERRPRRRARRARVPIAELRRRAQRGTGRAAAAPLAARLRSHRGDEAALAGGGRAAGSGARPSRAGSRPTRAGGAAAVSVLTEPTRFDGSLEHLRAAAAVLAPLGRAGDAQGLPGRSLPGARGACRRRRRRAPDPAHAAPRRARRDARDAHASRGCSCCWRRSMSTISMSPHELLAGGPRREGAAGRRQLPRSHDPRRSCRSASRSSPPLAAGRPPRWPKAVSRRRRMRGGCRSRLSSGARSAARSWRATIRGRLRRAPCSRAARTVPR